VSVRRAIPYWSRARTTAVTDRPLYVTRPLLEVLVEIAADGDPDPVTVSLLYSAAGDLEPTGADLAEETAGDRSVDLAELDPDTPIFSDFYFPDVGRSLDFVFGVDLGTPAGQTQGRFVSHPDGDTGLSMRDDLHAAVLVAVPPWGIENVAAYDRDSTLRDLGLVAAGTPDRDFEG
jgi:hypothetical protein